MEVAYRLRRGATAALSVDRAIARRTLGLYVPLAQFPTAIPEPAGLALLGVGALTLLRR